MWLTILAQFIILGKSRQELKWQITSHTPSGAERKYDLACLLPSVRVVLVYLVQGPTPREWWSSLWAESVSSQDNLPQTCPQANLLLVIP